MELANQYGVNLSNIYKTVADVKGAEQERGVRQEQLNKYRRERLKELSDDQIKQARAITEMHGKAALYARQNVPEGQRGQYIMQYVASQPKEVQDAFAQKYGTDHAQIEAKIPFMLNDIISVDKELESVQKEKEAKQKQADILEGKGVQGAIDYSLQELKNKGWKERTEETGESREEAARIAAEARVRAAKERGQGTGDGRKLKPKSLGYQTVTTTDPKTGAKTVKRVNYYDGEQQGNVLKPPPPLVKQPTKGATYKPSDVVKYGTKDGRKVAQMKDGSIIYVK